MIPHKHGLKTLREEIALTARPKIQSQSQIFRYGRSIFCLPHWPNFIDYWFYWFMPSLGVHSPWYERSFLPAVSSRTLWSYHIIFWSSHTTPSLARPRVCPRCRFGRPRFLSFVKGFILLLMLCRATAANMGTRLINLRRKKKEIVKSKHQINELSILTN